MRKLKDLFSRIFKLDEEKRNIEQIDYEELERLIRNSNNFILIDVRNPNEYAEGHLPGAINIPNYEIENKIYSKVPDKEKLIIVYCRTGKSKRSDRTSEGRTYEAVFVALYAGIRERNNQKQNVSQSSLREQYLSDCFVYFCEYDVSIGKML